MESNYFDGRQVSGSEKLPEKQRILEYKIARFLTMDDDERSHRFDWVAARCLHSELDEDHKKVGHNNMGITSRHVTIAKHR